MFDSLVGTISWRSISPAESTTYDWLSRNDHYVGKTANGLVTYTFITVFQSY